MRRAVIACVVGATLVCALRGEAQVASPPLLRASITLPGRVRCATDRTLTVDAERVGDRLALVGCVSDEARPCAEASRVLLDAAATRELLDLVATLEAQPLCAPPAALSGDPPFTIATRGPSGATFDGQLPRVPSEIDARTRGTCSVAPRLAWLLVQRFGAGSPSS